VVIDTGGLASAGHDEIGRLVTEQSLRAVDEADVVLMMTDARAGRTGADADIADQLRATGKPVVVAVNKCDGLDEASALAEFHALGLEPVVGVSAAHRRGIRALVEAALGFSPEHEQPPVADAGAGRAVRVCIVGRPNVGKSTLINQLVGEQRVVAHDMPGTTRDSVDVPFSVRGRDYVLVDTAGVRRRARVSAGVERFSVVKTLQAIAGSDVAVVLLDAHEGFTEQDAHLVGHVVGAGRALCIAVNKWDAVPAADRKMVREGLTRGLSFIDYAREHTISALHGRGIAPLLASVDEAWAGAGRKLPTPDLTRTLLEAVERNPPPLVRGRRIKLRYAHQGGSHPPVIVVHGNQTDEVPEGYRRYLSRFFRRAFELHGTPVVVELKTGDNPYKGRRNKLTPRQQRRRKRLMRHIKR
jgi:GTP-binding protein